MVLDLVERELPKLKREAAGSPSIDGGGDPGSAADPIPSARDEDRTPGPRAGILAQVLRLSSSPNTEEAVRQMVNKTILPEVLGRQVGEESVQVGTNLVQVPDECIGLDCTKVAEIQRVVRYVDDSVSRSAKTFEVEALRR